MSATEHSREWYLSNMISGWGTVTRVHIPERDHNDSVPKGQVKIEVDWPGHFDPEYRLPDNLKSLIHREPCLELMDFDISEDAIWVKVKPGFKS